MIADFNPHQPRWEDPQARRDVRKLKRNCLKLLGLIVAMLVIQTLKYFF